MSAVSSMFDTSSILPAEPVDADGQPLDVLHDREYRVQAYRKGPDRVLIRGAVRDQKPPGLYLADDPEPLTVHHMQIDIEVAYPQLEIVAAGVAFEAHPNDECPAISTHYEQLVGLSIARGFTHRVRELFGGPRGCTHTTALLQAMAPVAVQTIWSLRAAEAKRGGPASEPSPEPTPEQRRAMWQMNVNTCHVWAEDSEWVGRLEAGEEMPPPAFVSERLVQLGMKPDDWRARITG